MSLREKINKNQNLVTGATVGVIALALVIIGWQMFSGPDLEVTQPDQAIYTTDGGKTWFSADSKNVPPFQHEGKEAVQAYLYTCDNGATQYVGYLKKYPPQVKAALEQWYANPDSVPGETVDAAFAAALVKSPEVPEDPKNWVPQIDGRSVRITSPKCPNGLFAVPVVP